MAAQPAFIAVPTQQSLTPRPPAPPPEVSDYCQRAFQALNKNKQQLALAGITETDFKAKLTTVVQEALQGGGAVYRDWSSYKLPHELILEDRAQAALRLTSGLAVSHPYNALATAPINHVHSAGANSRKRKSVEADVASAETGARPVTPPWQKKKKTNENVSLADRATGKSKNAEKKKKDFHTGWFDTSEATLEQRRQRFGAVSSGTSPIVSSRDDSPSTEPSSGPIVGTCLDLEKNYFRLTAPPNPNTVRPLPVLVEALKLIKRKWKKDKNYSYVCDQLKSMRQDLTVQHVKNSFTIEVYEIHARIALQMKDLGEYNQCQTQLQALYKLELRGRNSREEFLAYRILYIVYTCNRTDMNDLLADLTTADKKVPIVKHALDIRAALASGNYHKFFRLYGQIQGMQMVPYLMDMFIERERLAAMATMCKAYKHEVNMNHVVSELAFDAADDDNGSEHHGPARRCEEFLLQHGGASVIARKDDTGALYIKAGQAGPVFESAKQKVFKKVDIKGQI